MGNKLSISLIILFTVVGLYFLNLNQQKAYNSFSTNFITLDQNSVNKFIIQSQNDALEIVRQDTSWAISGHDSLIIKEQTLSSFFDKVINLKSQALMTSKQEKWHKYNIEDSTGTHVAFIDYADHTIGYFVFGRSSSDYARSYARKGEESEVYLLDTNILYNLQTRPQYWGEAIKKDDIESLQQK